MLSNLELDTSIVEVFKLYSELYYVIYYNLLNLHLAGKALGYFLSILQEYYRQQV